MYGCKVEIGFDMSHDKKRNEIIVYDADDIESLLTQIDDGQLVYVDVALSQAWRKALQRWPLLHEWNEWSERR